MFFISEAQFERAVKKASDARLEVYKKDVQVAMERLAKKVLEDQFIKVEKNLQSWIKQVLPYTISRLLKGDEESAAEIDAYVKRNVRKFAPTKDSFTKDDKFIKELVKAINEYQIKS